LCNGQCTGSATVTPSGGTGPYTYSWAPSGGTAATTTGRCAGTYTCTVTDANGCTTTRTFNITQPPALTASAVSTPATCGNNNGSATVTASGGTGPYTYNWAPSGGTGTTAPNLGAGSYTVTVIDANGCTTTANVTVASTGGISASITATVNIACFGGNTGSATVTPSGGTGPFTYSWSPSGGTGATASGLTAGSYTATVTDVNGCIATASVTLTQPPQLTATASATPVSCNGGTNGTASVTASGGVGPYTYNWAPSGGTGSTASGLGAGTYTVTVTDANGCVTTATAAVTQPTALTAVIAPSTNVSCNGGSNGSATVTAGGGTGPYTYNWAPSGGTGATASGLAAGTYTVTVTDANSCTVTAVINITQPTPVTGVTSSTPATCGNANGIGTVVASGGTGPYTYNWAPAGGTGASTTGVLAGTYTVTITDANGCTGTATVNIINAGSPTVTITASTNILCFGGTNGSATASASGGTGPYTYAWTPSGGTGTTASGLAAGSYTITVTDANGCTANASVTLTQPPQLTATASATPVSCNGGTNGTASVTASGGVGPYTYNWAPSGGTGSTASGLGAGTYTVTVTDANGCTTTASATVTQPTVLTAVIAPSTNVSCNGGSNGSATVTAGGGTGPYTYNWAPSGGTGATASGLAAGSYTVTVTDANSCTVTAVINITQPTPVTGVTSSTPATCGNANGIGTVVASGGTGPYTYNWAPAGGTGSSTTGVLAGTYTVTITDANGCTGTATVNIINAGSPTVTITASTNILCFGGTNGSATASASGGTGPYTYAWTPSGGTGTTASGLAAGSYTITVTDANGCTANASVTLTQPPQLTATASATPVSCNGGTNGTASVTASGGVGPYTYNWAPSGGTGSTASGLGAGTYTVTVTDANGCTTTASATVTQPTVLTAVIAPSTNVSCNGGSNGSATVTAGGGTAPYTYNWAPSGGTGATASGLAAGSYTVTVTDANSCTVTAVINITQPTPVTGVTSSTPATCGNANGIGTVVASGGTGPYTYNWAPAGGTGASTTGVVAGAYTVTITDANGCNGTATVNIINAGSPTVTITASTNVTCFGANDGTASASATGGTTPYTWAWTPTGGNTANATALGPNTYTCTVTDANNCTAIATVTITEPPQLLASLASQTDVLCFGAATGAATVNATGGTNPLTYAWAPTGGNAATATGLTAGSYTCTITDANNCTTTQTVTITEPPQLVLAVAGFDATCNGACNGQVVVIPTGGVQPYNFLWNTGCTSPSCNSMCVGSYSITVTDANGCIASDSTAVNEPAAMQAVMSSTAANCNQADGSATVTPSGGTGPYTYSWAPAGGTGATTTGVFAGNYTVTITDANNCTLIDSVNVPNAPGVAVAVVSTTDATCAGDCNGQATISASGGTGPYTIAWPSGGNALTETGLCAGTYIVNVNDANGCPSSATVTILQPQPLQVAVPTPAAICIGQSVTLSTVTSGGTPAYTEVWTPAGPVVSPTATTTYTVTVTDANGCTVTPQTVTVNVNPPLNVVPSANVSICSGAQASLSAAASGGDGSYTYTWSPATSPATGSSVNASPGTTTIYTVTVTDGCGTPAATANITVTVFAPPAVTFSVDNQSGCAPLCVSFTNSTPGATSCAWDFGDNTTDNTTCTPVHCYNTPGSYDIILNVIDGNGCASTLTMPNYITVNPNPVAEFSFGPQPTTILNPTILFTDESNGATAWSWTFGDLLNSSSTLQNPAFTYPDTGCYDVTLTVTNAFGCSSDTTHPVCIDGEFVIYVPNAFTPNDDNKNDIFNAQGMGIDPEHFEMWIFDRWGNMIFYTDNLNKGWDGRANYGDNIAQIDTYVWKIKCTDILGQKHNLLGKVSLIK
jgi:gliding motility-associated-like protein